MALPPFIEEPNPEIFLSNNYVVLDVETTNVDHGNPLNPETSLIMTQMLNGGTNSNKVIVKEANEFHQTDVVNACEAADFVVAHSARFELGWLRRMGVDNTKILMYDTMIGEWVLYGNLKPKLGLDAVAKRYGLSGKISIVSKAIKAGICPSDIPTSLLRDYGIQDVLDTHQVFLKQRERLKELELLPVMWVRSAFTVPLQDIESNGMHLDGDRVFKAEQECCQRINDLQQELTKFGDINWSSPDQKREIIFDTLKFDPPRDYKKQTILTPAGDKARQAGTLTKAEECLYYSTAKEALLALKPKTKKQKDFIELLKNIGKENARHTKILKKFKDLTEEKEDAILYFNLSQTRAQTHRVASSGREYKVQGQNVNREYKSLITSRHPEWVMGEADYGQLEFKSAAVQAQCPQAIEDITNGVDVHSATAEKLTAAGEPTERQEAKEFTFKPLYGGTSGTKAQKAYFDYFKARYHGITEAQERWKQQVYQEKKLRIASGLIFYWPDCELSPSGYLKHQTNICNYPVQSFASADIVPLGTIVLWYEMKSAKMSSFLVNSVHDSAVGEIHPDEQERWKELVHNSFNAETIKKLWQVYKVDFNVPLDVDVSFGASWGGA